MLVTKILLGLCSCVGISFADVAFLTPAAGGSVAAATAFTVTWQESNTAPLISALSTYTLSLFSGSNTNPVNLGALLPAGTAFSSTSVSVTIPPGFGGASANAVYFLGMTSVATAGGTVLNYSNRFIVTGMAGTMPAAAVTGNAAVTDTAGPPTVNNVAAAVPAAGAGTVAAGANPFTISYNMQQNYYGDVRYAPMQPSVPTKITAKGTNPLWPTSSASIATTYLGRPTVTTTYTQSQTISVSSHANTASAAPQPSDDMAKFLARWKD